jgi:hypothetical protein
MLLVQIAIAVPSLLAVGLFNFLGLKFFLTVLTHLEKRSA